MGRRAREMMINAYASRERPRGWPFLAHHWELIIVSLEALTVELVQDNAPSLLKI